MQNKMEHLQAFIAFSLLFPGTAEGTKLLKKFGTPEALFSQDVDRLLGNGDISEKTANKLKNIPADRAEEIFSICRDEHWQILTPESPYYPESLKEIGDYPPVLYADGDLSLLLKKERVGIVGTRKARKETLFAAYQLGRELSENNIVTVSGGAVGIDSAAHEGALLHNGSTICVLGNGFGAGYLPEKKLMRQRIRETGLLLSETPPFQRPDRYSFPRRNRLIVALSDAVCVMQSETRGGSMISAEYALKYGKRLFAVSDALFPSPGCQKLLAGTALPLENTAQVIKYYKENPKKISLCWDGGALPPLLRPETLTLEQFALSNAVTPKEAEEAFKYVRKDYNISSPPAEKDKKSSETASASSPVKTEGLGENETNVLLLLETEPKSLDELSEQTGLSPMEIMNAVTVLELSGLAESLPGNRVKSAN